MDDQPDNTSIPIVEEEVAIGKRKSVTGGVRVTKAVEPREELVEQTLQFEQAHVRRVPVNRVVEGPQPPRVEGDTLIIPVVEEALEVRKIWTLKEEIYVTRSVHQRVHKEVATLLSEEVSIERFETSEDPQK